MLSSKMPTVTLLALMAIAQGCVRNVVTLKTWKPAATPVHGVRRIAVLPFSGPDSAAELASDTIRERLTQSKLFQIADPQHVASLPEHGLFQADGETNANSAIFMGRQLGADAVVVGRVALEDGQGRPRGSTLIQIGETQSVAAVEFQVIDVRTGLVRVDDRTTDLHIGDLSTSENDPNAETVVLGRLVRDAAEKAAGRLVPHLEPDVVELANDWFGTGSSKVREGNALAHEGKWVEGQGNLASRTGRRS